MPRTLLTFLGAGAYIPCKYDFNGQLSPVVTYVQQAMADIFCRNWNKEDRIMILLTQAARQQHWENNLSLKLPSHITIETIDIPDGLSEEQIWQIFSLVFERLREDEEVIYDITHGFRSLPMLGITLLNYAKFLKNIAVQGIYYGAFEVLGPPKEVEQKFPDPEQRIAPILNLTSFSTLHDWTTAAGQFLNYGITDALKELAKKEYAPLLKQTQGQHEIARRLKDFTGALEKFSNAMQTSNGPGIIHGKDVRDIRIKIQADFQELVPAFQPLLHHISTALSDFDEQENILNGLRAVEWCLKNNLIQQGFTLLQENMITYVAAQHQKEYMDRNVRQDISSAFKILSQGIPPEQWHVNNQEFVQTLTQSPLLKSLISTYDKISMRRNELNHARFNLDFSTDIDYKKKLSDLCLKVKKVIY